MKTTLLLFLLCLTASAQNALVKYYPANAPYNGLTNWPKVVALCSNNVAVPAGWDAAVATNTLADSVAAQQPVYDAGVSNQLASIQSQNNSNYLNWFAIYTNIPTGIADCTTRTNQLWSIYRSLASGTNNQTQINSQTTQLALQLYIDLIYHRQILDYLTRLGPGLQALYNPASDPTQ